MAPISDLGRRVDASGPYDFTIVMTPGNGSTTGLETLANVP